MRVIGLEIFRKDLDVFVNRYEIGSSTDRHSHNFIEIAFIAQGSGIHCVGNETMPCTAGEYFIINYDIPHQFICNKPMLIYNCIFTPEFIDCSMLGCKDFNEVTKYYLFRSIFDTDQINRTKYKFIDTGFVNNLFEKLYDEYIHERKGYKELLKSYVVELIIYTLRQADSQDYSISNIKNENINTVISFIKQHYIENVPLEKLAMMAFLSPGHFSRAFKSCMGITVTEFKKRLRVEQAKRLLTETEKSIEDIAGFVGYQDAKYFSKTFTSIEGVTPTQYRKSLEN